jgi:hypothetical protein
MARTRRQTEKAVVTLEELPRAAEALTAAEAETAKGGQISEFGKGYLACWANQALGGYGQSYTVEDFIADVGG